VPQFNPQFITLKYLNSLFVSKSLGIQINHNANPLHGVLVALGREQKSLVCQGGDDLEGVAVAVRLIRRHRPGHRSDPVLTSMLLPFATAGLAGST